MEILKTIGVIVGLLANIPLFIKVYKGEVKQNFSTWILWATLDLILTIALIHQNGNYMLSALYVGTSLAMCILLLTKKLIGWDATDTFTAIAVLICLSIWYILGDRATIIASSSAVFISSFPLIKETFLRPAPEATKIYLAFTVASLLSLLGAENWKIEQCLYQISTMSFSFILTLLSLRKPTQFKIVH